MPKNKTSKNINKKSEPAKFEEELGNRIKSLFSKKLNSDSDTENEYVYVKNAGTQTDFVSSSTQSESNDAYCEICDKEFKNARGLKIHISLKHKEKVNKTSEPEPKKDASLDKVSTESSATCDICKRVFKNATGLKIRSSKVHKVTKN